VYRQAFQSGFFRSVICVNENKLKRQEIIRAEIVNTDNRLLLNVFDPLKLPSPTP